MDRLPYPWYTCWLETVRANFGCDHTGIIQCLQCRCSLGDQDLAGPSVAGLETAKKSLTSRRTFLKVAAATGAVSAMYAVPRFTSFGPRPAYASITGGTLCLSVIDFDAIGGLDSGDRIGNRIGEDLGGWPKDWGDISMPSGQQPWSAFGVSVDTVNRAETHLHEHGAMIFKSSDADGNPTYSGGDADLQTPGYHATNTVPRYNILIVSEHGNSSNPDDDAQGGVIVFQFVDAVEIASIDMIDIDDGNTVRTRLSAYSNAVDLTATPPTPFGLIGTHVDVSGEEGSSWDNSWQNVPFSRTGVRELRIRFKSSGAVSKINFVCP